MSHTYAGIFSYISPVKVRLLERKKLKKKGQYPDQCHVSDLSGLMWTQNIGFKYPDQYGVSDRQYPYPDVVLWYKSLFNLRLPIMYFCSPVFNMDTYDIVY